MSIDQPRRPEPPYLPDATDSAPLGAVQTVTTRPRPISQYWLVGLITWGVAVALLGATGALRTVSLYWLPLFMAGAIVVPLLLARRSQRTSALVSRVDLANLTWFNVWRVLAAAAFFAFGAKGLLPAQFVTNAAWGDLIAGAAAPVVIFTAQRLPGTARRRLYLAYHVFSFGDFVVAVGTGLVFTLLGDPLMRTLLDTPMTLIPLWGVPITGAVTLLALRRLIRRP